MNNRIKYMVQEAKKNKTLMEVSIELRADIANKNTTLTQVLKPTEFEAFYEEYMDYNKLDFGKYMLDSSEILYVEITNYLKEIVEVEGFCKGE